MSFVTRFNYLFENTEDDDATTYEVPIPMVALVATAVRVYIYMYSGLLTRVMY